MGRLDKTQRRRALHPRQAHVEASRQAEGAPFGTKINLGVDRVIFMLRAANSIANRNTRTSRPRRAAPGWCRCPGCWAATA